MENTKKIMPLLIFLLFYSCNQNTKNHTKMLGIKYYNEQGIEIKLPKGFTGVKYNLFKDGENNLYFLTDKSEHYSEKKDIIETRKYGFLLQDSIYLSDSDFFVRCSNIIDTTTYSEIEKDLLYKDKNRVYCNIKSEYFNYPYVLLDLQPGSLKIHKGYYLSDNKSVYSYGGVRNIKIDSVDIQTFGVFKLIDTITQKEIYLGRDRNYMYHHDSRVVYEDLVQLPISKVIKDSLHSVYFPGMP